jgi:hypothetical protein
MSITIRSPIDGAPIVIENPLLPEHIEIGRLIWYNGFTTTFEWDCPAIITRVNKNNKLFRVRSLDDMKEQDQWYKFSIEDDNSSSRESMRLTEIEDVRAYIADARKHLESRITRAKSSLDRAKKDLVHFDRARAGLSL